MRKAGSLLAQLAGLLGAGALLLASPAAGAPVAPSGFTATQIAGAPSGGATQPDDIAQLGNDVVVGYQNGLGPLGEAGTGGATQSDVILYSAKGTIRHDWKVTGHVDGLAGDQQTGEIIVTVNEDGNTSLYTIAAQTPGAEPIQYTFSPEPDSAHSGGVFTGGGTDGVQVLSARKLLISASAPNNGHEGPVPAATATFLVTLQPATRTAKLAPTFADNAKATDALTGKTVTLGAPASHPKALTDPDSNALVPHSSPLYRDDYMLNSQGDQLLVFAARSAHFGQSALTELFLSREGTPAGVDDVAWSTSTKGTLYAVDHSANALYAITGQFSAGETFAGLDTIGTSEDKTEIEHLDLASGRMTPFVTGFQGVKGLLFTAR